MTVEAGDESGVDLLIVAHVQSVQREQVDQFAFGHSQPAGQ